MEDQMSYFHNKEKKRTIKKHFQHLRLGGAGTARGHAQARRAPQHSPTKASNGAHAKVVSRSERWYGNADKFRVYYLMLFYEIQNDIHLSNQRLILFLSCLLTETILSFILAQAWCQNSWHFGLSLRGLLC